MNNDMQYQKKLVDKNENFLTTIMRDEEFNEECTEQIKTVSSKEELCNSESEKEEYNTEFDEEMYENEANENLINSIEPIPIDWQSRLK